MCCKNPWYVFCGVQGSSWQFCVVCVCVCAYVLYYRVLSSVFVFKFCFVLCIPLCRCMGRWFLLKIEHRKRSKERKTLEILWILTHKTRFLQSNVSKDKLTNFIAREISHICTENTLNYIVIAIICMMLNEQCIAHHHIVAFVNCSSVFI